MPDDRLPVGGLEEKLAAAPHPNGGLPILDCNQCPLVRLLREQIAEKDERIADLMDGIEAQIASTTQADETKGHRP